MGDGDDRLRVGMQGLDVVDGGRTAGKKNGGSVVEVAMGGRRVGDGNQLGEHQIHVLLELVVDSGVKTEKRSNVTLRIFDCTAGKSALPNTLSFTSSRNR